MEELMYYVWQQRLFSSIVTLDETPIEIINPGVRNLDAGPDFFNAKVKIGNMVWAGTVEMHVKASDWFKHNHHKDRAYDNVILHVVLTADAVILRPGSSEPIQTVLMRIPQEVMQRYQTLTASQPYSFSAIRCAQRIPEIPSIEVTAWEDRLAADRLEAKVHRVRDLIEDRKESWQEALYVILCRSLGTGVNSDAFERLARSLPYSFIQKHLDQPLQVKALLWGQAGIIPPELSRLQQEYDFLRAKFQLTPMHPSVWKRSSLRPLASPENRLHALMLLICTHQDLHNEILEAKDILSLQKIFIIPKFIGVQTANSLIINAAIPIIRAYGHWQADDEICERATDLLMQLPAESNRYMDYWLKAGVPIRNAFDSQALLQLYREYCEPHKCMNCRFGCWFVRNKEYNNGK